MTWSRPSTYSPRLYNTITRTTWSGTCLLTWRFGHQHTQQQSPGVRLYRGNYSLVSEGPLHRRKHWSSSSSTTNKSKQEKYSSVTQRIIDIILTEKSKQPVSHMSQLDENTWNVRQPQLAWRYWWASLNTTNDMHLMTSKMNYRCSYKQRCHSWFLMSVNCHMSNIVMSRPDYHRLKSDILHHVRTVTFWPFYQSGIK